MAQSFEELSQERKKMQAEGLIPDWYTTQSWQMFKSKYAVPGEVGVRGRHRTIAKTLAAFMVGQEEEWEEKFFNLMWKGWLSPATPVLSNCGTDRGLTVSCSGQYVGDSVDSFYKNRHESAMLGKYGFGCSGYFGDVRARGSNISVGGKASGAVPVILGFSQDAAEISQGSQRRGSTASYLPIEHGDFDELIDYLEAKPDGLNIGWVVDDGFVAKLKSGDAEANRRYSRALYCKLVTGRGYFFFVDKANRHRPQVYKDLGLDVKASNLCVAPETLILTDSGYEVISDLAGQFVNVWNGDEWSNVQVIKTGENQELVTVKTNQGFDLDCTPYHKFYVVEGFSKTGKVVEKRAHELQPGDKLIKLDTPVIQGNAELSKAYQNGFYSGDGCNVDGHSRIYLYGEKQELVDLFEDKYAISEQPVQNRTYFNVKGLKQKFFVPDTSYTVKSRVDWFAGLLDSDGCVLTEKAYGSQSLQVASTQSGFLESVQLMLQTLGVQSKVVMAREKGVYKLPANDGSGENKDFSCAEVKRLLVNGMGILKLLELGLKVNRLNITGHVPNRDASGFITIQSVEYTGRRDDTYCFTEPKKHMGVFNGILTGQCSEIMLHSSENLSFSCVLSSMNLYKYDEWKDTQAVFEAAVFLDCVVSDFLVRSEGIPGLTKVRKFTENGRAIGLGVLGFSSYLQKNRIPFEDIDAELLNDEIFKLLHDQSLEASKWLAKEYGEPLWLKGYGLRNTHRSALAPTKSTSLLMGGMSESVFPDPGMVFEQGSAAGGMFRIVPEIYALMTERGVYSKETLDDIVSRVGSVQHVSWLTPQEKEVFKTAFEVDQETILRYASRRQKYICQGQSLNFFVSEDGDEDRIAELHTKAFLDEEILSLYYIYSRSGVVVNSTCVACEA